MPPIRDWLRGAAAIGASIQHMVFAGSHGFSLVPIEANGAPAFAAYARDAGGTLRAMAIHGVDTLDGQIAAITAFVTPGLFPAFGLPLTK
jgi:RNA polymerase sigma-70 factor (ECF subfamily)